MEYNIGETLSILMKKKGLNPINLAEKLKITKEGVYNILKKKDINTELLKRISYALEIDIREFFGGAGNLEEIEKLKKANKDLRKDNLEYMDRDIFSNVLSDKYSKLSYSGIQMMYHDLMAIFNRSHFKIKKNLDITKLHFLKYLFFYFIVNNQKIISKLLKGEINYPEIIEEWIITVKNKNTLKALWSNVFFDFEDEKDSNNQFESFYDFYISQVMPHLEKSAED